MATSSVVQMMVAEVEVMLLLLILEITGAVVSAILLYVAVQVLSASMVKELSRQSGSPLHPAKVELTSGVAVRITCVPEV